MAVRMKMICHELPAEITDDVQTVQFGCVWEPDEGKRALPENAIFGKFTPWGSMRVGIANPDAKRQLKVGQAYYIDVTPVP